MRNHIEIYFQSSFRSSDHKNQFGSSFGRKLTCSRTFEVHFSHWLKFKIQDFEKFSSMFKAWYQVIKVALIKPILLEGFEIVNSFRKSLSARHLVRKPLFIWDEYFLTFFIRNHIDIYFPSSFRSSDHKNHFGSSFGRKLTCSRTF